MVNRNQYDSALHIDISASIAVKRWKLTNALKPHSTQHIVRNEPGGDFLAMLKPMTADEPFKIPVSNKRTKVDDIV
jgi:hypothetical protein